MNWSRWGAGMLLWILAVVVILTGLPEALAIALFVVGAGLIVSTKYGGAGATPGD